MSASAPERSPAMPAAMGGYFVAVVLAAVAATAATAWVTRGAPASPAAVVGLFALGVLSGRLREQESDGQVDLSFTSAILLAAAPMVGPFGAAVLAALMPVFSGRGRGMAGLFNAAMLTLVALASAYAYRWTGGAPLTALPDGRADLFRQVALPLLAADVALCVVNAALVAGMITVSGGNARLFLVGPFVRTLPVYLGYALAAFFLVVLWGPAGVGAAAIGLIVAPLLVTRWSYGQSLDERRTHEGLLESFAMSGQLREHDARRVACITAVCGLVHAELGAGPRTLRSLRKAAALHDLGILVLPDSALDRREPLTDDDLLGLVGHPAASYAAVRDVEFLDDAALGVLHHHERVDGRGYPAGLAGDDIPLVARILAVGDVYEALAWPGDGSTATVGEVLVRLRGRVGTHLDGDLVDALERALTERGVLDGTLHPGEPGFPGIPAPAAARVVASDPSVVVRRPHRHASPVVSDRLAGLVDAGRSATGSP